MKYSAILMQGMFLPVKPAGEFFIMSCMIDHQLFKDWQYTYRINKLLFTKKVGWLVVLGLTAL